LKRRLLVTSIITYAVSFSRITCFVGVSAITDISGTDPPALMLTSATQSRLAMATPSASTPLGVSGALRLSNHGCSLEELEK